MMYNATRFEFGNLRDNGACDLMILVEMPTLWRFRNMKWKLFVKKVLDLSLFVTMIYFAVKSSIDASKMPTGLPLSVQILAWIHLPMLLLGAIGCCYIQLLKRYTFSKRIQNVAMALAVLIITLFFLETLLVVYVGDYYPQGRYVGH